MLVILGSWGRRVQNLRPAWVVCSKTVSQKNPRVGDVVPPWVWSLDPVSKVTHKKQCILPWAGCRHARWPWEWLSAAVVCPLPPVLRVWASPWTSPLVKGEGLALWQQGPREHISVSCFYLLFVLRSGAPCMGKEALLLPFNLKPSEFERTRTSISLLLPFGSFTRLKWARERVSYTTALPVAHLQTPPPIPVFLVLFNLKREPLF